MFLGLRVIHTEPIIAGKTIFINQIIVVPMVTPRGLFINTENNRIENSHRSPTSKKEMVGRMANQYTMIVTPIYTSVQTNSTPSHLNINQY
jgi:hypothetical protein